MTFVRAFVFSCVGVPVAFSGDVRLNGDEHFFVNGIARDFAVGDFDADGRVDVATTVIENDFTFRLHLLRGDGFGSFTQSTMSLLTSPGVVVSGDFDGDGDLDLMIGSSAVIPTISLENDGVGAFTDPGWSTYIGDATDLEVGDVDLDGDLDVVAAAPAYGLSSDHVRVLLGDGAFGFSAQPDMNEPGPPTRLALADLDVDGDLDIASVISWTSSLRIRRGAGGATFAPVASYATGTNPNDVVFCDVKGDGVLDVVTSATGASSLAIHFGNGSGTLSSALLRPTGNGPTALAAGRMDSDSFDDLVVATNQGAVVHRGLATGIEANGTPQRVLLNTSRIALAHLDGDLVLDAVGVDSGPHVARAFGDGLGGFQRSTAFGTAAGGSFSSVDLEFADLDADGDLESIEGYGSAIHLRTNAGGGAFAATTTSTTFSFAGNQIESIASADLNGDGYADLVARSYEHAGTRLGFGNGTFGAQSTYAYSTFIESLAIGDLDGDGDVDLALGEMDGSPGKVQFRWNNGAGVMLNPSSIPVGTSGSDPSRPSIATFDFDNDGKLDLAAVDAAITRRAKILRGLGGGAFVQAQTSIFNVRGESIAAGDIDGDGFDDLVGGGGGNHSHDISGFALKSDGSQFASLAALDYKAGVGPYATTWVKDASLADVNGDGFGDALFSATSHEAFSWDGHYEIVLFPGTNAGTFGPPRSFAAASAAHAVNALDLDGDARAEVGVLGSGGPAPFSILEHDCDGKAGTFGDGCVGSGGFTPRLGFQGCPTPGGNVALRLDRALGGATVLLFAGLAPASLPVSPNCDLLTVPLLAPLAFPVPGVGPGAGEITIPLALPGSLGAVTFVLQAFVVDSGVTLGAAATRGVTVVVE